jgi:glutamate carboxypeptidase
MTDTAQMLAGIQSWVEIESQTGDLPGLKAMADRIEADYAGRGAEVERVPGRDGHGEHLIARAPWRGEGNTAGILILSHMDTVHPRGTLARFPFSVDGDRAFGPGIYDMKGGAYVAMEAVRLVAEAGGARLPVSHLFLADEEVGSPTSRDLIEDMARAAKYVLVTEPAREGGKIVTGRKGVMRYEVTVEGRAAHAGARHEDGINAIAELARIALVFDGLTDYERGITCNVGTIGGGTGVNVVPARATCEIDVRVPTAAAAEEVQAVVANLAPRHPEARLTIAGGLNRPPYERTPAIAALFDHAKGLAAELGWELKGLTTGGGSDGNFTAPITPTLDGLGVDGQGGHTEHEQCYVSSLEPRRDLMRRLIETLE